MYFPNPTQYLSEDEDEDMFYHHPVFRPKILAHHSLTPTAADERIIHLGMIIKNVGSGSAKANGLKKQFVVLLNSILEQRAKMKSRSQVLGGGSTPLQNVHVTILTDFKSAGPIER